MKYSVAAIAALAGVALSQITLPSCAIGCATSSLPANCNGNPQCICADTSFISNISCCVATACSAEDQKATLDYAVQLCSGAGVSNLPTSAVCTNGTVSSTAASTASGSSAASSASDALSSLTSAASSVASSISSAASSAEAGTFAAQGLGAVGAAILGAAALL